MYEKMSLQSHLLVVDDDLQILELLKLQLEVGGYRVTSIDSGPRALEFLAQPERLDDPVDVVLLDIMMPGMDGFDVLRRIKGDPALMHNQVIILTSLASGEDQEKGLQTGADDFIKKPWDLKDLTTRIQLVLQRKDSHQSIDLLSKNINALRVSGQALLGFHSLDEVLNIILGELKKVLDYTSASIFLLDHDILRVVAHSGFRSESQEFAYEDLQKLEHVQNVIHSKKALIINNTFDDPRWIHLSDSDYIRSWMGIPLIARGKLIGILNVDMDVNDYFTDEHTELATGFAHQAALAIENARLIRDLERQSTLTRALVKASNKLAATMNVEVQLHAVWEFVSEQMKAPMFYVGFCDPFRNRLDIKMYYEMKERQPELSLSLVDGNAPTLSTHVAMEGVPVQWHSLRERADKLIQFGISPNIIGSTCASCLVHPLVSEGKVIGVIAIQSDQPHVWDQVDVDVFIALADMVAATANTSLIFQDIQTDQERLISAFDASAEIKSLSDPDQILPRVATQLQQILNCSQVNVILVDEHLRPIHHCVTGPLPGLDASTIMGPNSLTSQVITSGEPRFMDDLSRYASEVHPETIKMGTRSSACLPLPLDDRIIGALWVHFDILHHFTAQEQVTLKIYAKLVARTYESIQRFNELERLRKTAEDLASVESTSNIFAFIARIARDEFQAHSAAIWAYDQEQKKFILENSAATGIDPKVWEIFKKVEPKEGGAAYAVMEQGWLPIRDIDSPEDRAIIGDSTCVLLTSIGVKSFQGVTLRVDNEIMGVLYINYADERDFSPSEQKTVQAFASQAGMAAKKAKLFEQLDRAKQTAHIVAEYTAFGDLKKTLDAIVNGAQSVINCDTITLYTYNERNRRFGFPPAMIGVNHPDKVIELDFVEKNSVPYRIVEMDKLYLSEKADEDPRIKGKFTQREGIKSFAGVPLIANSTKVGVMCLSFRHRHRFTSSEISIIKLLSMQAAVAIQNAASFKKEKEKTEILHALHKASQSFTGLLNEKEILKTIAIQAGRLTSFYGKSVTFSCVGMLDDDGRINFQTASNDQYFQELGLRNLSIDMWADGLTGICGRAVHLGTAQLVADVRKDPDYLPFDKKTGSELVVPIKVGDEVIGVINVEHPERNIFSEDDRQVIEMLASNASIAIQNARTFDELNAARLNIESLTNLFWTGAFAQAWQHSIRNHSVIVSDCVKLIRDDLEKGYPMDGVFEKLFQIESIVDEIQSIPMPPLSSEDGIESILVHQLIQDRIKQYRQKNGRFAEITYNVELQTGASTSIRAGREWIRRLLDILIHNAVNAMAESEQKVLTLRSEMETGVIKISVIDTGHGIPMHIRPKLFKTPITKAKGEKGSGIGLYLGMEIAKTYGGLLEIETTNDRGTIMVVWFPVEE